MAATASEIKEDGDGLDIECINAGNANFNSMHGKTILWVHRMGRASACEYILVDKGKIMYTASALS